MTTWTKTSYEEFRGHMTQSTMKVITNPRIWPNKDIVSSIGKLFAPHVLKKIVITRNASIISVYCQFGNAKSALFTSIMTSMRVVTTNVEEETLASQPSVLIHPEA